MNRKKKVTRKPAKKPARAAHPSTLQRQTLKERIAELDVALDKVELYRSQLLDALISMTRTATAADSLAKTISRFEAIEFRSVALLSISVGGLERSQRVELLRGEGRRLDLLVEADGLADIQLLNMGRELCFMTETVYLGRVFSKGSFIRAGVQAKTGQVIQVTVQRP
jgi:hypothetical protein